jgi:hypothetical protein
MFAPCARLVDVGLSQAAPRQTTRLIHILRPIIFSMANWSFENKFNTDLEMFYKTTRMRSGSQISATSEPSQGFGCRVRGDQTPLMDVESTLVPCINGGRGRVIQKCSSLWTRHSNSVKLKNESLSGFSLFRTPQPIRSFVSDKIRAGGICILKQHRNVLPLPTKDRYCHFQHIKHPACPAGFQQ